jgi:DNA primase
VKVSFSFDPDIKERVRLATDIVDLMGTRLELKRQGSGFVTKCPWHNDTRPSLQINPARQIWKCWVCNIGGDVFNYFMQMEGCSFPEALQRLAERAGISLQAHKGHAQRGGQLGKTVDSKAQLQKVLRWAEEFYHRYLMEAPEAQAAREYLIERGITAHSISTFRLGMAPAGWSSLLDKASENRILPVQLDAAGLAVKRERGSGYYDRFRNRLIFPIRDREGKTIAFGGRVLPGSEEQAKYINSPETRLFHKSRQLYGLDLAHMPIHRHRQAIVMEGYTDVIVAHQFGVDNAVAVLGTALGAAHLKMLKHSCDSIVLLLDGDEAGQRRSDEVLELFLHAQLDVRIASLPHGLDPADFLLKNGIESFRNVVSKSCDALEFRLRRATTGFDPLLDTHRANRALEEMLSLLAKVPHEGLISNEAFRVRQNQIMPRLARTFGVPEPVIREQLSAKRSSRPRSIIADSVPGSAARSAMPATIERKSTDLSPFERELLELIIIAPQVAPIALERVQSGWLECDTAKAMLDVYQELDYRGASLEFESVLVSLEDAALKSLLVTLHEQASEKARIIQDSAEQRLRVLTQRMGQRGEEMRQQKLLDQLQTGVSEREEIDILQDVIRQARLRQGLKSPESTVNGDAAVSGNTRDSDVPVIG